MKKNHYTVLFGLLLLAATSCKKTTEHTGEKREITKEELSKKFKDAGMQVSKLYNTPSMEAPPVNGGGSTTLGDGSILTEAEAINIVQPLVTSSTNYLMQEYGINLSEDLPVGDPRRALVGQIAIRLEDMAAKNITVDDYWFTEDLPPVLILENNLWDCALEAVGIQAVKEFLISAGNDMASTAVRKKALKKMIKKVVSRTLGFVGTAIAVYEFGDCMDWW